MSYYLILLVCNYDSIYKITINGYLLQTSYVKYLNKSIKGAEIMREQQEVNDYYSRWSYDQFRLMQPHIETDGLWMINDNYYIKCKDLSQKPLIEKRKLENMTKDMTLEECFQKQIRMMTAPVELVENVPRNAQRVNDRSLREVVELSGVPMNSEQFRTQLSMLLPFNFPTFELSFKLENGWLLEVERELTKNQIKCFENALQKLQSSTVKINSNITVKENNLFIKPNKIDVLDILSPRNFDSNISPSLKRQYELDEQIWINGRYPVISAEINGEVDLSDTWNHSGSSCLIDCSMYGAHNIRNYLTMFKTIILVSPTKFSYEKAFSSLGISESELIELVRMGKVKILFPQSIEFYDLRLLEELNDVAPNHLMFSRQLALRTIQDTKMRNPLLYPALDIEEKQELLASLFRLASSSTKNTTNSWIGALAVELSRIWSNADLLVATRGAIGTAPLGIGTIIAALIKSQTGKDYSFELMTSSMAVEWSGAMKSTLCPVGDISTIRNTEILSNIYSGVRPEWKMNLMNSPNIATGEILTIAKDVPVIELAKSFSNSDIDRFHTMIQNMIKHHNPDEMNQVIESFNQNVKMFERRKNRMATWDIKGVIVEGVTTLANTTIPLSGLLMNGISKGLEHAGGNSKSVGYFLDRAQASIYRTTPEAILVSRMKNSVKDLL